MANKNMKVFIDRPATTGFSKVTFESITAKDVVRLPRRVQYRDIQNYAALKDAGFLREESQNVSGEYGGSNVPGTISQLGLRLPRTEKLILLLKDTVGSGMAVKISGNERRGLGDTTITIPSGSANDIYTIDLYDLGLHIPEDGTVKFTPSANCGMILIARF